MPSQPATTVGDSRAADGESEPHADSRLPASGVA
jgi:hypothetical protein